MASTYATSYEQTTVTQTYSETHTKSSSGAIDQAYIKGIPAIIKGLEGVFTLLAFILVVVSPFFCTLPGSNSFFNFATMCCFVTTLILYILLLFKLHIRVFRCSCIFWPLVGCTECPVPAISYPIPGCQKSRIKCTAEMAYYIGAVVLLLLADIILSSVACTNLLKAGVAFGWFALGAYAVDLGFSVRTFLHARSTRSTSTTVETTTTTAPRY